ncbi:hypothetical protein A3F60_04425 [Candidatus Roizmanbacteria bacterium RIFCSPHIGHO2_12_FULL_39_8]|uniref:RNase H type-1 domain-containing protein n=1 Tax=Candidatus Roizmanbacteria bacterium RIFCSPHIGHO2_12_FULL_39_8 TaxID=1802050 RepID=A0A1F7I0C7_9BACT|nr:MAG: hypothetical protein A3F60_04425 [Candidatus Roizmanbacteria bacterium RIFCSPHIGHO2_12_FULL_39_8]
MELNIYTDGGSIHNPGPAAYAFVLYLDQKIIASFSKPLGNQTNNFAEYSGLVAALEWIKQNTQFVVSGGQRCVTIPVRLLAGKKERSQISKIICHSDSELMVNQLNGKYKVKNTAIRNFIFTIRILEQEIQTPILYTYIPREENQLADSLVKKELTPELSPA